MQEKQVYIARQPIVDINKNIISYELLFRHNATTEIAEFSDDLEASSNVMVNTLTALGSSWLDNKKAFINVSTSMIDTGLLELLPESNFILEIDEASQQMPNVNEKIMAVKDKGFEISLDDFVPTENAIAILQKAQYIKLDVLNNKKEVIERIVKIANKYDIHPIAKKVETNEMFEWAKQIGFKSFQGFFFAKPETLKTTVLNPAYEIILTIMNKVRQGAELKELEDWFKKDPGLSYKLFRYINSAGFGLTCEIQSLKHAITVLGVKPLYKWLTLLLVTSAKSSSAPVAIKTAIIRGRLTELLSKDLLSKQDQDNLFIVGVFSLLDVILGIPLEKIVEKLSLPDTIIEALVHRHGIYGPFISIAEACEKGDFVTLDTLATQNLLDAGFINKCHLDAISWVETLGV